MKEHKISETSVRLLQGDITTCDVEAVVNVSGRMLVSSEQATESEPIDIEAELWQGENQDKDVIITPGEGLKADYILNMLSIETSARAGASKIRKIIRSVLQEAQIQNLESLAIPAIGTGVGRFSTERCAEILLEELTKSVSQVENSIHKVIFVLTNQKSYKIFEQVLDKH